MRLKGLTGSSAESKSEDLRYGAIQEEKNVEDRKLQAKTTSIIAKASNVYNSNARVEFSSAALVSVETDQFDEQVKSMMTKTEKTEGNQKRILWACNICGKEDQKINIKSHIDRGEPYHDQHFLLL